MATMEEHLGPWSDYCTFYFQAHKMEEHLGPWSDYCTFYFQAHKVFDKMSQRDPKGKLSYLDQLVGPIYFSLIFFYQTDAQAVSRGSHIQISQRLKKSLSHTLTTFYPLAGRIQDNFTIDCNDAGVEFIDARAVDHTHQLMDAIQEQPNNINKDHLKQYLPVDPTTTAGAETTKPLFLVQITYFDCGGIVVGFSLSHQIADCASAMNFINAWARANETDGISTPPIISFDLANYFPGREFPSLEFGLIMPNDDQKFRIKRFVFDKVKLAALRQLADSNVKKPTRVELVSAFIWKELMWFSSSTDVDGDSNHRIYGGASHAVNLRPRMKCLENVFGNCVMLTLASEEKLSSGGGEFHEVVSELRRAIRRVDEDYITKTLEHSGGYLNDLKDVYFIFTSWCGFPVYEADFGWGKPSWFCPSGMMNNCAVLLSSRCGERVEAWVNMNQDALAVLESKFKLI